MIRSIAFTTFFLGVSIVQADIILAAELVKPVLPGFQLVQNPPAAPVAATNANAQMAGRYAVLRDLKVASTCILVLAAGKPSAKGNFGASLEPGCADKGMGIFNPVGWRLDGDKLVLVAKRGHEANLAKQADGTYAKDKNIGTGKPLILKKL